MSVQHLQHVKRVQKLYRKALKTVEFWAVRREVFYSEAERVRAEFEKNRHVTDLASANRLVEAGEAALKQVEHPDPYIIPYMPGGSLYERNPPFPPELHQVLDWGRENY